jgi:hypothetical protein
LQAGQRAINDMSIEERLTRNIPKNVSKVGWSLNTQCTPGCHITWVGQNHACTPYT